MVNAPPRSTLDRAKFLQEISHLPAKKRNFQLKLYEATLPPGERRGRRVRSLHRGGMRGLIPMTLIATGTGWLLATNLPDDSSRRRRKVERVPVVVVVVG